ncbi:dihydrodipicolinate synthase family protein [Planosporangium thailandense]|uniref:Dihydrodipicolinate synthase family protein n=1 Tax=Planosporangium thailandense TaxID=765197 RepID=A0ABX0Y5X3_9ACTN|nr:dihydrodipicolinate synthase family protein [Planosporangium thailandense]
MTLPRSDGTFYTRRLNAPAVLPTSAHPATSRVAYAAAHVVADPLRACAGDSEARIDWDATLAVRRRLWGLGLGVAEAMDTAQRGMGLSWGAVQRLVRESLSEASTVGADVVVGVSTDQLPAGERPDVATVLQAYREQIGYVESHGGRAVVMASRHLAAAAAGPDDYQKVYSTLLAEAARPVVLHWLGEAFDPALRGYWGSTDFEKAADVVLGIINDHPDKVAGIKMSLLDADKEVEVRRRLPSGVRLFTGDDYNYVDLIAGDGVHHSDALLGAFALIAPYASAALAALDADDVPGFRGILSPTLGLSRLVFEAPTYYYKVGVVWLAYLTGAQNHFRMIGGLESGRSVLHLVEVFEHADDLGLFPDPDLAAARMAAVLQLNGVG